VNCVGAGGDCRSQGTRRDFERKPRQPSPLREKEAPAKVNVADEPATSAPQEAPTSCRVSVGGFVISAAVGKVMPQTVPSLWTRTTSPFHRRPAASW